MNDFVHFVGGISSPGVTGGDRAEEGRGGDRPAVRGEPHQQRPHVLRDRPLQQGAHADALLPGGLSRGHPHTGTEDARFGVVWLYPTFPQISQAATTKWSEIVAMSGLETSAFTDCVSSVYTNLDEEEIFGE